MGRLGIVRACADDVGCALSTISALPQVAAIFKLAKVLAGLDIKFAKGSIVPLRPCGDTTQHDIQQWIRSHLPEWRGIGVAPFSEYLGVFWAPASSTCYGKARPRSGHPDAMQLLQSRPRPPSRRIFTTFMRSVH